MARDVSITAGGAASSAGAFALVFIGLILLASCVFHLFHPIGRKPFWDGVDMTVLTNNLQIVYCF
jgi:hypothetical protein